MNILLTASTIFTIIALFFVVSKIRHPRRFPMLMPGVDAYYGTATYVVMADGARFEVTLTRTALIARPANDSARAAVGN